MPHHGSMPIGARPSHMPPQSGMTRMAFPAASASPFPAARAAGPSSIGSVPTPPVCTRFSGMSRLCMSSLCLYSSAWRRHQLRDPRLSEGRATRLQTHPHPVAAMKIDDNTLKYSYDILLASTRASVLSLNVIETQCCCLLLSLQ